MIWLREERGCVSHAGRLWQFGPDVQWITFDIGRVAEVCHPPVSFLQLCTDWTGLTVHTDGNLVPVLGSQDIPCASISTSCNSHAVAET